MMNDTWSKEFIGEANYKRTHFCVRGGEGTADLVSAQRCVRSQFLESNSIADFRAREMGGNSACGTSALSSALHSSSTLGLHKSEKAQKKRKSFQR